MNITGKLERFQYFNFETNFEKNENLFKKLGYHFLLKSTKIEDTPSPYKTALSQVNVKTNRMRNMEWTYHKEQSLASNYFISPKILFQFKNLL